MPTPRLSHDSIEPLNVDSGSDKQMGMLPEDLQEMHQDFNETFNRLQDEVLLDLSHLHENIGKQMRQYAEQLITRQQTMLNKRSLVKDGSPEPAENALLGARQKLASDDRPLVIDVVANKSQATYQDVLDGHVKKRRTDAVRSGYRNSNANVWTTSLPGMNQEDDADTKSDTKSEELVISASENGTGSAVDPRQSLCQDGTSSARTPIRPMKTMDVPKTSVSEEEQKMTILAKIERSKWFDTICAFVLVSNAIFIGIQVDALNGADDTPTIFIVIDCLFTFAFLLELVIRMGAADSLCVYFTKPKDWSWNWFDFSVTSFAVVETSMSLAAKDSKNALATMRVVRVLRVLRMVRVVRIIRVMRFFRSLRILIAAILGTMKSGIWTAMLLVMIVYLFALVFAQGASDFLSELMDETATDSQLSDQQLQDLRAYFGSLPRTIFTLWKAIVGGIDWEVPAQVLSDLSPFYVAVFVFYIMLLYLAVLNVVAGLFLQTAVEQAQSDLHDVAHEIRQQRQWYASHIEAIFARLDKSQDGVIQPAEFEEVMSDAMMNDFLDLLGIQVSDAWTLYKLLDRNGTHNVDAEEFVEGCLRLRGAARSIDIAQLMADSEWMQEQLFNIQAYMRLKLEEPKSIARAIY